MRTPYGAQTTVLLPEPLDDLSEDDEICSYKGGRCNDSGGDPGGDVWFACQLKATIQRIGGLTEQGMG